jgi:hypothetical protein
MGRKRFLRALKNWPLPGLMVRERMKIRRRGEVFMLLAEMKIRRY